MALGWSTALPVGAAGAAVGAPAAEGDSRISIDREPAGGAPICLPQQYALGRSVSSDDESFTLTITVRAPLCSPVVATAAIYSMPGNGRAWPQQLVESTQFTLTSPEVVTVTFTKTCDPVQFDVVTGATPQSIAPWASWHGPLLFPFDVGTSQQHWGSQCTGATSTTTTPPGTTPTTITPTTATPTTVPEGSTTTAAPATTTPDGSTTVPPEVGGSTTVPDPYGPSTSIPSVLASVEQRSSAADPGMVSRSSSIPGLPAQLAITGLASRILVLSGLMLVFAGLGLLVGRRLWRTS